LAKDTAVFVLRSSAGRDWAKQLRGTREELSKFREHFLTSLEARVVWFVRYLSGPGNDTEAWKAITQQDPELAAALASQLGLDDGIAHTLVWDGENELIGLRSDGLTISEVKVWGGTLADPGADWRLEPIVRKRRKQR